MDALLRHGPLASAGRGNICRVRAKREHLKLSSECGTCKTVKAIFWPWLQGQSLENALRCALFAPQVRTLFYDLGLSPAQAEDVRTWENVRQPYTLPREFCVCLTLIVSVTYTYLVCVLRSFVCFLHSFCVCLTRVFMLPGVRMKVAGVLPALSE